MYSKVLKIRRVPARGGARPSRGRPPLDARARQRILDATTEVFLEKGYERASTSEIARRARTSKQTLYRLFPAKADLFLGVMSAHTEALFQKHVEYIASDEAPEIVLMDMGVRVLELFSTPRFLALYRIIVAEAPRFPELARGLWRNCMERGYQLLREYLRLRHVGGPAHRRAAEQYVSLVVGDFVFNAMLNPDLKLNQRELRRRVRKAVHDFLILHPVRRPGK